jgi:hypothetical protein
MAGRKIMAVLLGVLAIIIASGSIGAAYACYDTPHYKSYFTPYRPHSCQRVDLMIQDQDESWGDGVRETWTVSNMAPGDEFVFDGHFVGLRSQSLKNACRGGIMISCNYNPWRACQPNRMARYMEITRCTYSYANGNETWQIDCLTGKATRISKKGNNCPSLNRNWQIRDVDRDGRVTFYDLMKIPLINLPLSSDDEARFEMSVRFHQSAGNEFQGDTFNLAMIYRLTTK